MADVTNQDDLIKALRGMTPDQRSMGMPGYAGAKAVGSLLMPGLTDYLTKSVPYPSMNPTPEGKIKSTGEGLDNPHLPGAALDVGMMGLGGAGLGAGGAVGGALGRVGAEAMPAAEAAAGGANQGNRIIRNLLMGGAQNMDPTPAQGATRLLPDERRAIEVEKQKSQNAAQAAMQQKQAETEAEVEKQKALGQNQLEQQKQQAEFQRQQQQQQAELQKQQEQEAAKHEANMPFRERHSNWNAAMPAIGDAAAIGLPLVASLLSKGKLGKMAGAWENAVGKGQTWAEANPGTKKLPTALARELQAHAEQWGKHSDPVGTVGHITGALSPLEASQFPMESDALTLPPDAPDKWALMHQDPKELAMRTGSAAMQGLPFASAGKLIGKHMVTPAVPMAETQGLLARAPKPRK
jgi:Skp family chaperone for outer membrane proteins